MGKEKLGPVWDDLDRTLVRLFLPSLSRLS
jgi:hypothetical protein